MNQALKKLSASVLAATMLLSFIPTAYAEKADNDQMSTFDFSASDYAFDENDGTATIKIKREGTGNAAAKVVFKAADLVSEYGVDYEILDEKGKPYAKVEGEKPDPAEFIFEETGAEDSDTTAAEATEETESTLTDDVKTAVEEQIESTEVPDSTKTVTRADTGSNLLNAQADYLGLPAKKTTEEVEDETKQILDELYEYYDKAQGAECVVNFGLGEVEKEITVKILDNDQPNSQKIFSLCLMATDSEYTTIAPNATTYVTIQDDEETQPSDYAIVEDNIRLTSENPTANVTIKRTGGEMYFSTVELSTVTLTAPAGSFEALDNKAVAFVPGQTEATVEIKALDFNQGGEFGLRLDADCDIDTLSDHYTTVTIVKDFSGIRERTADEMKALEGSGAKLETKTLADAGNILGSSTTTYKLNSSDLKTKFNGGSEGSASFNLNAYNGAWHYAVRDYVWGTLAFWPEKQIDFSGIKKVSGNVNVSGTGWAFQRVSPDSTHTAANSWDNNYPANHVQTDGSWRLTSYSLDVSKDFGNKYLAFGVESGADPGGTCSHTAYSNTCNMEWQKYTFAPQKSAATHTRKIYDFSTGAPQMRDTFYEGENVQIYNPTEPVVLDKNGKKVDGFYANYGDTVYIHSADPEKEAAKGLFLKSVYFVNADMTARDMGDGTKYAPASKFYKLDIDSVSRSSDDPYVSVKLDQSFAKTLQEKGVVTGSSANIKIFPVYGTRDVEVTFFNTDSPYQSLGERTYGYNYDQNNRYSEFTNVLDAALKDFGTNNKSEMRFTRGLRSTFIDNSYARRMGYTGYFPSGSVIRLGVNVVNSRIPNGVCVCDKTTNKTTHIWYKAGDTIYDELNPDGKVLKQADYSKAEFVVSKDAELMPCTDKQTFSISYLANEEIPDYYKGDRVEKGYVYSDLEYSVVATESISTTNPVGVDSKGNYKDDDVYTGMEYSFTALPPEGYVTEWSDRTGDLDRDGYLSEKEMAERRRTSNTPANVYGNVFEGRIDADRVQLVYHFVPKTSMLKSRKRTGTIERSTANFLQVLNDIECDYTKPVSNAMVSLGGETAKTDYKGNYTIDSTLPALGTANLSIIDEDETHYFTYQNLGEHGYRLLPALDEFKAVDITASVKYDGKTSEIQTSRSEGVIPVKDGECRVALTVSSSTAARPKEAHFFITDKDGNVVVACDNDTKNYKVNNDRTDYKLTSTLTFNPKKDCYANYQLWVQFEDYTGKLYSKIATGYVFSKPLDMGEFIFPLIGSSDLEDFYRSDFVSDLIGDPLADIGIDSIPLEIESRMHSPASLSEEAAADMKWTQYSYSYAWGKDFDLVKKDWGKKKDSDSDNKKSSDADLTSTDSDGWEVVDKKDSDKDDDGDDWTVIDKDANGKLSEMSEKLLDSDDSKVGDLPKDGKEAKSKFKTQGSFNFSISPSVGFRLTLSQRSDKSKYYFEDLLFYVQIKADLSVEEKIVTPIGVSVIIGFGFEGKITGIYYMYNNYNGDPLEGGYGATENKYLCPFTAEDFGLFKKFDEGSSVRRDFYLFIDPTISVSLGVDIGIASVTVSAKFVFDFDFRFTEWKNYAYGDLKIKMDYTIKVLGIKVWSDNIGGDSLATFEIFSAGGQEEHISFDPTKAFTKPSGAYGEDEQKEKFATDDVASRAYLDNRTSWNGTPDTPINAKGSTEITLETGAADDARVQLKKLNDDGDMLMVWVDDDAERSDINRRAIYYSISSGDNWSAPKQIDNDGTLDDYPDICEAGDGRLLVTWSSADRVLKDNEGVEEALKALDIKAAFFDVNTKEFGKVEKLTKTTEEDFTADFNPHAAYDKKTNRIILYYTKTEYEGIDKIEDIGAAASVTAYLFYEDGKWSNDGSFYTDEELSNMDENYRDYYKKQWYGQRFLDLRTKSNSELFLCVDSTAIGYNGLGLFAWTIDWDKDLTTNDDRDLFLQIYDFENNYFTHVIKLTNETGIYTQPQFARSNDNTYLFFGTVKTDSDDNSQGEIEYINISDCIKNEYYTLATAGEHEYYELKYTTQDAEGNDMTVSVEPNTAMPTENIEDYEVTVSEDGRMYLFWAEKDPETGTSAEINAAYFLGENAEGAAWSNGVKITGAGDSYYYTGIGGTVVGDSIKLGAVKSNFGDEADNSLIFLNHVPYSEIMVSNLDCSNIYPMPGDQITLTADVKNTQLKTYNGDVTVSFKFNNEEITTAKVSNLTGASTVPVSVTVECPEFDSYIDVMAETKVDNYLTSYSIDIYKEAQLDIGDENIDLYTNGDDGDYYAYTADITNIGNLASDEVTFKVYRSSDETVLGEQNVGVIAAKESQEVKIPFDVDNSMFTVDKNGVGSLDVYVRASYGELESDAFNYTVSKQFDKEAMELLDKVTAVTFDNGGKFTMKSYEEKSIMPKLDGVEEGKLTVIWTASSDPEVVGVFADDSVTAYKSGKATLTGYIVPNTQNMIFDGSGNASEKLALDDLPTDYIKEVSVEVSVENDAIFGDLDGDGFVNSADALKALRISVQLDESTPEMLTLGDIDGDGSITSADALEILRYSVQLSANDKIGKAICA